MGQVVTKIISAFCFALILFISPAISLAANAPTAMMPIKHEQANTQKTLQKNSSKAGMVGVVAGGAAGAVASVAAVSATGSVAGFSAAGVTSGLAAMGSLVGGGMVGGLAVSVALPIIGAAGIGWAAYKIFHHPVDSLPVLPPAPIQTINKVINIINNVVPPSQPVPEVVDTSSYPYILLIVVLLLFLFGIFIVFRKYSKEMNRKLNDLTTLVLKQELEK
jgi:hypothetical protein